MSNTRAESAATRAGLGGLARIDRFGDDDPALQSLIFNKALELGEGPTVEVSPLSLPLLSPLSDVSQLLHYNHVSCLQAVHDRSADAVVQVAHNASLLAPKAFDETPCASTPFGKKLATQLAVVPPNVHRLFAFELEAVRGNGQVHHADVNTDALASLASRRVNLPLEDDMHVEGLRLFVVDKLRRTVQFPVLQKRLLEFTKFHRDFDAPFDGRDRGSAILSDGEGSGIEPNGCVGSEAASSLAGAAFERFRDFIAGGADKLGREIESLPHSVIGHVVECDLVGDSTVLMGYLGDVVAGVTKLVDCFKHRLSLFRPGVQLAPHSLRQLRHGNFIIPHIGGDAKGLRPWRRFLSPLKRGVSSLQFL